MATEHPVDNKEVNAKKESTAFGYLNKYDNYKQQSAFLDYSEAHNDSDTDKQGKMLSKSHRHAAVFTLFDKFIENIPSDYVKQLPIKYSVYFGIFAYSISICTLLFFAVDGYLNISKQQFISLDKNAGYCTDVMKPISNSYYASNYGDWEGMELI